MKKRLLLVFLKEPLEGKVKTRLAASIGEKEAVLAYKAIVQVLWKQLRWITDCRIRFCYAPDDASEAIQTWLLPQVSEKARLQDNVFYYQGVEEEHEVDFRPQGNGDLGERMENAFRNGFSDGYEKVAIIGSDCPEISNRWINAAFVKIKENQSVLGPSPDGGYCFLAMERLHTAAFREIPWSHPETCSRTIDALTISGAPPYLLPELTDIDHVEEWLAALNSTLGTALNKALKTID